MLFFFINLKLRYHSQTYVRKATLFAVSKIPKALSKEILFSPDFMEEINEIHVWLDCKFIFYSFIFLEFRLILHIILTYSTIINFFAVSNNDFDQKCQILAVSILSIILFITQFFLIIIIIPIIIPIIILINLFIAVSNNDVDQECQILAVSILSIIKTLWKEMETQLENETNLFQPASNLLTHVKTNFL